MTKFRYSGKDKGFAKKMGFVDGGSVKQVSPGVYSPMNKGDTVKNGVYTPGRTTDSYSDIDSEGNKVPPIQNNGPPSDAVMESGKAGRYVDAPDTGMD